MKVTTSGQGKSRKVGKLFKFNLSILSFEFSPESMSEKLVSKEFCEIDLSLFCLSLVRLVGSLIEVLAGVVEVLQVGLITESVLGVSPETRRNNC